LVPTVYQKSFAKRDTIRVEEKTPIQHLTLLKMGSLDSSFLP